MFTDTNVCSTGGMTDAVGLVGSVSRVKNRKERSSTRENMMIRNVERYGAKTTCDNIANMHTATVVLLQVLPTTDTWSSTTCTANADAQSGPYPSPTELNTTKWRSFVPRKRQDFRQP